MYSKNDMVLIVGLGNPEQKYCNSRHNTGYFVIDKLEKQLSDFKKVVLLKPENGMNISGKSVKYIAEKYQIQASDIWVVYDDVDLRLGMIRFRNSGSTTHNGVRSIIKEMQTQNFNRIRIGIGPLPDNIDLDKFVMQDFSKAQKKVLTSVISITVDKIIEFLNHGFKNQTIGLDNENKVI